MLYIDFDVPKDKILEIPTGLYQIYYEQTWFDDPVVVDIACKIDGLKHVFADFFENELLGRCSGREISGGAKTVILAYLGIVSAYVLPLSWLGENCFPVLGSLDIEKDITFDGDSVPMLYDWKCDFISRKTGRVINSYDTYREEWDIYAH